MIIGSNIMGDMDMDILYSDHCIIIEMVSKLSFNRWKSVKVVYLMLTIPRSILI